MIARDGLPIIMLFVAVTLVTVTAAVIWPHWQTIVFAAVFVVLTGLTVYFFRDPERVIPTAPGVLVAPADGRVVAVVDSEQHLHVGPRSMRVSIFLSVLDVHINRVPADGSVAYVNYIPGKFLAAFNEKASTDNEQSEIGMITPDGHRLAFKQIAGLIARRIVCRVKAGDTVAAGDRMGWDDQVRVAHRPDCARRQ